MDIDIEKLVTAAAKGIDLSNFKGDVVGVKIVENEINGNVEEGGVAMQKIFYGSHTEDDTIVDEKTQQDTTVPEDNCELREGSIDEHKMAFRDAMLHIQGSIYSKHPMETMIKNVYDWYAVMRLGKDLGIFSEGWTGITALFKTDKRFEKIPKDYRNFSPYTKYIDENYLYPGWQCSEREQSYFRKFLAIGNLTYTIYKKTCQKQKIKPYH